MSSSDPVTEVALQIHHLDDDEEADFIENLLRNALLATGSRLERPTSETNSILIFDNSPITFTSADEHLCILLDRSLNLLSAITSDQIQEILSLDLGIRLFIQAESCRIELEPELLAKCGELGIRITIWDQDKAMAGISFEEP